MSNLLNAALSYMELTAPYLPLVSSAGVDVPLRKMSKVAQEAATFAAQRGYPYFKGLHAAVHARRGDSGKTIVGAALAAYGEVDVEVFAAAHPELATMGIHPAEIILSVSDAPDTAGPTATVALRGEIGEFATATVLDTLRRDYVHYMCVVNAIVSEPETVL